MFNDVKGIATSEARAHLEATQKKMSSTVEQLRAAKERLSKAGSDVPSSSSSIAQPTEDWTSAYEKWERWNTVEALSDVARSEEDRVSSLERRAKSASTFSHMHDHSEERKIFEMPEEDKMQFCEAHRAKGNYLVHEGLLPKAVEQYQIALSYYSYCFPEGEEKTNELNALRVVCLCNLSLCYFRMGYLRNAIESASTALQENNRCAKALYYRAKAYRELDEYEPALNDLKAAFEIMPADTAITKEIASVRAQMAAAKLAEIQIATSVLHLKKAPVLSSSIPVPEDGTDGRTYVFLNNTLVSHALFYN
jgi:tetratricopeptide (TPR) repeat protein